MLAFGKPFYREGLLSRGAIVKSIYAQVVFMLVGADEEKMEKIRESMLSLTKGWNQEHIASIVRALESVGYGGWYVLEQDNVITAEPAIGAGPFADASASVAYLRSLLG